MDAQEQIRVRIAPSPTGYLHLGTARTALYNFLFAKKHKGRFIVRVEDTDPERSKQKYENDILRHLLWLGLKWDEGPKTRNIAELSDAEHRGRGNDDNNDYDKGKGSNSLVKGQRSKVKGQNRPYRQSERTEIYQKYINKLLKEGKAFYCFHSRRRITQKATQNNADNRDLISESSVSDQRERSSVPALNRAEGSGSGSHRCSGVHWCEHKGLSRQEVKRRLDAGESFVIRFKTPKDKNVAFKDLIRGEVEYDTSELGDFSIAKSAREPLYNMACVVDDTEMLVSHVIRGEDHIPNTPKQILLYEALGQDKPQFAHLPLILGPDEKKLSKRHGATSCREYKKEGYLPSALNNFMALLGWHPSEDEELFYNLEQLTKAFSLDRVRPSGAIFDIKKLNWFNKKHLKKVSLDRLTKLALPYLKEAQMVAEVNADKRRNAEPLLGNENFQLPSNEAKEGYFLPKREIEVDFEYIKRIVALEQERATTLAEIPQLTDFFFKGRIDYDPELLIWKDNHKETIKKALQEAERILKELPEANFSEERLEQELLQQANHYEDRGTFLWPLRVALTGKKGSPGPFEVAAVLGKKECIRRIKKAIEKLE